MALKKDATFPKLRPGDQLGYDEGRIALVWEVIRNFSDNNNLIE